MDYVPPEVILGDRCGPPIDWWALGIFAYEVYVGKTPFIAGENGGRGDSIDSSHTVGKEGDEVALFDFFSTVLQKPVKIPQSMGIKLQGFVDDLLEKHQDLRLRKYSEVRCHPFLKEHFGDCWERLVLQQCEAPRKPFIESSTDLSGFVRLVSLRYPDSKMATNNRERRARDKDCHLRSKT